MRRVVGTDDVWHALVKPAPQAVPMRGGADGWVHLRMTAQAGISVFGRKRQVLGRNLACGDILVLSDQFQFSGRGYMQYVDAPPCLPRQFPYAPRRQHGAFIVARSEERRTGKEWVRTCRTRWSPDH